MLNEKIAKLLNTQINKDFYSAYLYLHFANFYVEQGLNGFANWYQIQAQEERDHALLMLQYKITMPKSPWRQSHSLTPCSRRTWTP